jgi:hypothetical protein
LPLAAERLASATPASVAHDSTGTTDVAARQAAGAGTAGRSTRMLGWLPSVVGGADDGPSGSRDVLTGTAEVDCVDWMHPMQLCLPTTAGVTPPSWPPPPPVTVVNSGSVAELSGRKWRPDKRRDMAALRCWTRSPARLPRERKRCRRNPSESK